MSPSAKASAKRRSTSRGEPVRWRDGVHLSETSIWCDARRARDVCFVSVAGAVGRSVHGQLIATAESLALVHRPGPSQGTRLAAPYAQPFSLGTHRLELFRSGHGLGAASLLVKQGDLRMVYAGAINPQGSALGGAIDHRHADVLIVRATYGQRDFAFAEAAHSQSRLYEQCQQIVGKSGTAVLLVTSTVKALDLTRLITDMALPVRLHRRYHDAAQRVRAQGTNLPLVPRSGASHKAGHVVIWPVHARGTLDSASLPAHSEVLLVSGRASLSSSIAAAGASAGIALSNQADHKGLVDYIQSSGAKSVYVTDSPDLGADLALSLPNLDIKALGPPTQLQLF